MKNFICGFVCGIIGAVVGYCLYESTRSLKEEFDDEDWLDSDDDWDDDIAREDLPENQYTQVK